MISQLGSLVHLEEGEVCNDRIDVRTHMPGKRRGQDGGMDDDARGFLTSNLRILTKTTVLWELGFKLFNAAGLHPLHIHPDTSTAASTVQD